MKLQTWLRWLVRIILPFTGWRVPVALLRGPARASGREVVMLRAGSRAEFIAERFFAQEPTVERSTRVPVWRLQRRLDEWRSSADLVVVGVDRISARLFLGSHYLAMPQWISSWMKVPEDLAAYGRAHPNTRADIRRVRIKNFECHFSQEAQDFDLFYEKFHEPYITKRYGSLMRVAPRWMMRLLFTQGMIQWIRRNGERQAGGLITMKGTQYSMMVNGVLDGRMDLMKEGVLSALYVHSILEARRRGCTELNMGGSLPSLHDGVFRFKRKWATGLCRHEGFISANCVTLLDWNRLVGPVVEFLSQTSLIHHDQDGYSALWAFPHDEPLTAEALQQHYERLKTAGLRRFDILLPGAVPVGFVCPAEVRLIPLSAVGEGGPAWLKSCAPTAPWVSEDTRLPDMNSPRHIHSQAA